LALSAFLNGFFMPVPKFRVISDEEIPRFHPDFSARKVAQAMEIEEVLA